jgi:hypothetical protein
MEKSSPFIKNPLLNTFYEKGRRRKRKGKERSGRKKRELNVLV